MLAAAKVRDCMTASLVTFTPEMGVMEAIRVLLEKRISGAPVVDSHGHLAGMLSEKDCLRVALEVGYHRGWGGRVDEYMTRKVETVDADMNVVDVAKLFIEDNFRRYPVVSHGRLVGQISRRDVLKAIERLA